jgi:hypothetical protein
MASRKEQSESQVPSFVSWIFETMMVVDAAQMDVAECSSVAAAQPTATLSARLDQGANIAFMWVELLIAAPLLARARARKTGQTAVEPGTSTPPQIRAGTLHPK